MEKYTLKEDLKVFGLEVKNAPGGIGEAFDYLVNLVPGGFDRSYFGLCQMTSDGQFIYKAVAEEKHDGEAEKYQCQKYTIEKGEYLIVRIREWRKKTDSIKGTFQTICKDSRVDMAKPFVEWYKDNDEMFCMARKSKE